MSFFFDGERGISSKEANGVPFLVTGARERDTVRQVPLCLYAFLRSLRWQEKDNYDIVNNSNV